MIQDLHMLVPFLEKLLATGEAVLTEAPRPETGRTKELLQLLEREHARRNLDVPGEPLALDPTIAIAAGDLVRRACWALVSRDALARETVDALGFPGTARAHLSGDLFLRFLPQVERRARALEPAGALATELALVLGRWPLSGVLSDGVEPPLVSLDFGHAGLALLYAERLARNLRPAWLPPVEARQHLDLVWHDLGKPDPGGEAAVAANESVHA